MKIEKRKAGFISCIIKWEKDNFRHFSWRENTTPYRVFVSEILLKRTTSKAADRVFNEFLRRYPDIKSLYNENVSSIEEVLKPIGLYSQRAKGIKEAAAFIVENCNGEFPTDLEKLLQIPHIGPYTAGAIMSIGMDKPAPMVDSNVNRVISRVFKDLLSEKPNDKKVAQLVYTLLPEKELKCFNWGLIDFGALVCTYRGCCKEECPIKRLCDTYYKNK